jgi:hypothetical protein
MARRQNTNPNNSTGSSDTTSTPPDHVGLLLAAGLMMLVSWFGLYQLISATLPRIGGELWLFFILLQMAITSTSIPVVRYLNVRFTPMDQQVPPSGVIVRQSAWIGLFFVTCAWLQIPRALNLPLMVFIAMVFVVVEVFLRTREIANESG